MAFPMVFVTVYQAGDPLTKSHGPPLAVQGSLGARQLKFGEVPAMKKFDARYKRGASEGLNGWLFFSGGLLVV